MNYAEENDNLSKVIDSLHQRVIAAEKQLVRAATRIENDLDVKGGGVRHMWVVYSPTRPLSGSTFYLRKHSIAYAIETLGISWAKCRRMGYHCSKIYIVEEI